MAPKTKTTPSQSSPEQPRRPRRRRVLSFAMASLAEHHVINCSSLATLLLLLLLLLLSLSSRTNAFLNFQLATNTKSYRRHHDHREWQNPQPRRQRYSIQEKQISKRHHRWLASSGNDITSDGEEDDDNNTDSPNSDYYHANDIDWRAFRANLVQNGIPTSSSSSSSLSSSSFYPLSPLSSEPKYTSRIPIRFAILLFLFLFANAF
mmetsp:Transcript_11601/g.25102  ORF Transcript_11601/g.25102 Transcript_11601/m.25102 type:complete len:206 (+) Transcript_11601:57-674(+)